MQYKTFEFAKKLAESKSQERTKKTYEKIFNHDFALIEELILELQDLHRPNSGRTKRSGFMEIKPIIKAIELINL